MPSQLELINGKKLLEMLEELAKKSLEGGFGRTKICGTPSKRCAAPAGTATSAGSKPQFSLRPSAAKRPEILLDAFRREAYMKCCARICERALFANWKNHANTDAACGCRPSIVHWLVRRGRARLCG